MVKTRSLRKEAEKELNDFSVEELVFLAKSRIEEKLSTKSVEEKDEDKLPDVLLLNSDEKDVEKLHFPLRQRGPLQLTSSFDITGLVPEEELKSRFDPHEELMKRSVITSDFEKLESAPPISVSGVRAYKLRKAVREKTTGGKWYNMSAPEMTTEMKNDLKVLQMRSTLDRTHYYKSTDWKKLPKYFQLGTVVEGPAEFYSARIPKRQRKKTIVEELLADDKFKKYHKQKYLEFQKRKQLVRRKKKPPKKQNNKS